MLKLKPIEIDREPILQLAEQNLQQGNDEMAIRYYQQFLSIKKPHKHKYLVYYNLGRIWLKRNALDEGFNFLQKSVKENPDFIQGWLLIGNTLFEIQQFDQAEDYYREAVKLDSNSIEANIGIANVCMSLQREREALPYFKKCMELDPTNSRLLDRLSFTHFSLGEFDASLEYQLKFISLGESPESLFNLAEIYKHKNQLDDSIACFRKVIDAKPDWIDAHVNFSHVLLMNADYLEGWKEHEWRRKKKNLSRDLEFSQPHWNGKTDLTEKTILLYGEQGFGDTIQFVRYLPLFKEEFPSTKIIFECNPSLRTLLSQIDVIAEIYDYCKAPKDGFDYHCSIMSLPYYLKTTLATIPNKTGKYLKPDADKVNEWKKRINLNSKIKVGLVWHGRPVPVENKDLTIIGKRRNIPLDTFKGLFDLEDVQFYSLQKGDNVLDIKKLKLTTKITDYTEEFNDFSDTASFIENMDLVIGIDTGVIHLACAIGKPTWMLSRFDGCWRWMTESNFGDKSPWYSTLKIYRQSNWNGWTDEIECIKRNLVECHSRLLQSRKLEIK